MEVSQKHCVFISSTGRTGTKFFGNTLSRMIDDCVSVHEPDTTRVSQPWDWIEKMAKFGVPKMLWGQYRQCYSFGKLTTTRHRGYVDDRKARQYVVDNRLRYIESMKKGLFIESNHIFYGLIDLFSDVFPNSKFIWVMRDPRTWIRSAINSAAYHLYGPFDWDSINLSVRAYNFPEDPYADKWKSMSLFEKYCWYYNNVNARAFELMKRVPDFKVFRFEDLFDKGLRDKYLLEMLEYSSKFDDGFSRKYTWNPGLFDVKIHAAASKRLLSRWEEWSSSRVEAMENHCGALMREYGYGAEPLWLEKLEKIKNREGIPAAG